MKIINVGNIREIINKRIGTIKSNLGKPKYIVVTPAIYETLCLACQPNENSIPMVDIYMGLSVVLIPTPNRDILEVVGSAEIEYILLNQVKKEGYDD